MNRVLYIPKEIIDAAVASTPIQGKHLVASFTQFAEKHGLPEGVMRILEDHEVDNHVFEVHTHEADLWLCLEGRVTFICGGELVNPQVKRSDDVIDEREQRSENVAGKTEERILTEGDWLWIPPGVPHRHRAGGTARLVIVKIPVSN